MSAHERITVRFTLNGRPVSVSCRRGDTLLEALRYELALTGTKEGCGEGECGACSVLLEGELACSCLVLAAQAEGATVRTIEGLAPDLREGLLHPVQAAFVELGAVQCGFCIPGMVLAAADLLEKRPDAGPAEVRRHLAGNLCRCTGYTKIFDAIDRAGETMRAGARAAGGSRAFTPAKSASAPAPPLGH